jgi:hypothetical protein
MTKTQKQRQSSIFISNCGFSWTLHWCFCETGRTFPKLTELFLFTGRKTIWGPGNTVVEACTVIMVTHSVI